MEPLPKIVRERLQDRARPEVHPNPDLLAAFAENSLPERERLSLLEHLSACADCREVVSLAQPELVIEHLAAVAIAASPAPPRHNWSGRLLFGGGTVAACVVIGILLLGYRTRENKLAQVASKQLPAEPGNGQAARPAQLSARPQPTPPETELDAKLEPSAPPPTKSELQSNADSVPRERDLTSQIMAEKLGAARASNGPSVGAMAARPTRPIPQSSEQVTVSGEAAEVASAPVAAPLPPQTETKPASSSAAPSAGAGGGIGSGSGFGAGNAFSHRKANLDTALARVSANYIPTRWAISVDGATLLRSTDEGQSWIPVSVANNLVLRAVAAVGPEIWTGGKAGALYHSSDQGAHWSQVKPESNGVALAADIVSLNFPDPAHGKLTTAEGKVWTTSDGGKTWQTQ